MTKHHFQAEVNRLLQLVTHHVYSNKEVFLRELISNASDACDKLRHLQLTKPGLIEKNTQLEIKLSIDSKTNTLCIEDNGIGMTQQELIDGLGTIAKSGTAQFLEKLTGDAKKDSNLIGKYGIGFYTSFMVATKVEVTSLKAGKKTAYTWTSNGVDSFSIDKGKLDHQGTKIVLHLKEEAKEYLSPVRIKSLVGKYSEHISFPILLKDDGQEETLNEEHALWLRPKNKITPEQYKNFYQHITHAYDEPWCTIHTKAEGVIEYTALLFIPTNAPYDLYTPERKNRLKLYIKRIFITDDCESILPAYLRFVRGVVDTEDLPLSISRESLQFDPRMSKIKSTLTKKALDILTKKAKDSPEDYLNFWRNFGALLKEGFYEEPEKQDKLLPLIRFKSSLREGYISLEEYIADMPKDQKDIYYLIGEDIVKMKQSPQLEGFENRKFNVLLLSDAIDHLWLSRIKTYQDISLKAITEEDLTLSHQEIEDIPTKSLIEFLEKQLQGKVKSVRISTRLKESPVCFVNSMSFPQVGFMKPQNSSHNRILEVNPDHELIKNMSAIFETKGREEVLKEMADLLYDQALIVEGQPVDNAPLFAKRLTSLMNHELNAA